MEAFQNRLTIIALEAILGFGLLHAAELQPAAKADWEAYVRAADLRMQSRLAAGRFLWVDEAPDRDVRVRNGDILVAPGMENGMRSVRNGLIHHWVAAAFIPHAKLADVLRVAHDYTNYKRYYRPDVIDSRLLSYTGDEQNFSMRSLHRVLFITAALESEFAAHDFRVVPTRWYTVADSTRVQEVDNCGRPNEHLLPPDRGRGFIWRLHTITRYEERGGGVYVEMEAIALSRDIPAALRWLVNPAVARFSQNELMTSLRQTREAVTTATTRTEQHVNLSVGSHPPVPGENAV
jgi:hypothetical protein